MFKNNVIECDRFLLIRCRAFRGEGVRWNKILVAADTVDDDGNVTFGTIRVWDSVCGCFTSCHCLSAKLQAKLRRTSQKD